MDLTDIYRIFFPNTSEYAFYSAACRTSQKETTSRNITQIFTNEENNCGFYIN